MTTQTKPSLVEIPEEAPGGTNLRDKIYSELKRRILSGKIAPGQHLLEKNLCDQLQVSRTPLREALNQLGNENLVVFRPNCGYLAAPLSAEDARRLQELRRIVESKVAAMAAVRATEDQILVLRSAAEMPDVKPGNDASFVEFCRANARFHLLLARAVGNPLLEGIVMSSLDLYQRPAYLGIGRVTNPGRATGIHNSIVDALEQRDPIKAEALMCSHVINGSERIIRALVEAGYH